MADRDNILWSGFSTSLNRPRRMGLSIDLPRSIRRGDSSPFILHLFLSGEDKEARGSRRGRFSDRRPKFARHRRAWRRRSAIAVELSPLRCGTVAVLVREAVAQATHGLDQRAGPAQLLSQPLDVGVDGAAVHLGLVAPDLSEKIVPGP